MSLLPSGYLHTQGGDLLDQNNQPVRIAGVNWYGFDCNSMVPGGLDRRPLDDICATIQNLGFNSIRLPFCVHVVLDNPQRHDLLEAEPDLQGASALEIMDGLISAAGNRGLKVILDSHRASPGWSTQTNGLWYNRRYPESAWLDSWETLARRYAGNSTVIGCDVHNEPGSPPPNPEAWPGNGGSLWGYGDPLFGGEPRDWAAAATRAGNRILASNPNLLILVEGVRYDPAGPSENHDSYWFGGNLTGVGHSAIPERLTPVKIELDVPNRVVYSPHDYGPAMYHSLPWAQPGTTANSPSASDSVWDHTWGFIAEQEIAPILIGEFGTPNGLHTRDGGNPSEYAAVNDANPQGDWFSYLVDYIQAHGLNWMYWCLNGTQCDAPGRQAGQVEGYGVLSPDWASVASSPVIDKLSSIM